MNDDKCIIYKISSNNNPQSDGSNFFDQTLNKSLYIMCVRPSLLPFMKPSTKIVLLVVFCLLTQITCAIDFDIIKTEYTKGRLNIDKTQHHLKEEIAISQIVLTFYGYNKKAYYIDLCAEVLSCNCFGCPSSLL